MVVGVIREQDRAIRERMENHFVGDLKNLGYQAFSSLQEYGPKGLDVTNEEKTYEKLRKDSVDAVLTIVLLNKEKERYYVPGRAINTPYGMDFHHFWNYYHTMNYRIGLPGYFAVLTKYFWESNFYDLNTKELVYSVQTQSFDPSSAESLGHEYGKMIVQNMVKNNVLTKQPEAVKAM
jgi:hypothetical protein